MASSERKQRVLWAAMLSSVPVLAGFAWSKSTELLSFPQPRMQYTFALVAALSIGLSFLLPRQSLRAALQHWRIRVRQEPEESGAGYRSPPKYGRAVRLGKREIEEVLEKTKDTWLFAIAMCEAVALLGLVLGAIGTSWIFTAPFFVASALFLWVHKPRRSRLLAQASRAVGATILEQRGPAETELGTGGWSFLERLRVVRAHAASVVAAMVGFIRLR